MEFSMRRFTLILTVASLAAFTACISDKTEETGDTWAEGDADTDADADADADADSDADSDADADVPHDYKSYTGLESFTYGIGKEAPGDYDCEVVWDVAGTYRDTCADCEFAFDVALTYDAASSYDNSPGGDCSGYMADSAFGYGFSTDYQGYGPYLMYDYGGTWYALWGASFDGSSFTYDNNGALDYYYAGEYYPEYTGYYTSFYTGSATVSK
ncbi:MAG: hypothetical protein ACI9VR_003777 [Cognaticolwellia sp.]|jgi:hypothetical protein